MRGRFRHEGSRVAGFFLIPLQSLLDRVVRTVAREQPGVFDRIGAYRRCRYLIDARELPFLLLLQPDPSNPRLRAVPRRPAPLCDARIAGSCRQLVKMVDGGIDGDALFFSRDIHIAGNLEAVVCLRNAIDDVDGSVMDSVWGTLGRPGKFVGRRARAWGRRRSGAGQLA